MKGVTASTLSGGDQVLDPQVAVTGTRGADANDAIGDLRRHAFAIRIRNRSDSLNAQTLARPNNANGDLTSVGDQYSRDAHEFSGKKANISVVMDIVDFGILK